MKFRPSILNALLALGVVAAWTAYWVQDREISKYEARLPILLDAARELVVVDPEKIYGVNPHPEWYGEEVWLVHLPVGQSYAVHAQVDQIQGGINASALNSDYDAQLESGQFRIEYRETRQESGDLLVEILANDQVALTFTKPEEWHPKNGSTVSSSDVSTCKQFEPEMQIVLLHRRHRADDWVRGVDEFEQGITIWIEKSK